MQLHLTEIVNHSCVHFYKISLLNAIFDVCDLICGCMRPLQPGLVAKGSLTSRRSLPPREPQQKPWSGYGFRPGRLSRTSAATRLKFNPQALFGFREPWNVGTSTSSSKSLSQGMSCPMQDLIYSRSEVILENDTNSGNSFWDVVGDIATVG